MEFSDLQDQVEANLGRDDSTTNGYIQTAINYILTEDLPRRGLRPLRTRNYLYTTANSEKISLSGLTGFKNIVRLSVAKGTKTYTTGTVTTSGATNRTVTVTSGTWNTEWIGFIGFDTTDPASVSTWYQISTVDSTTVLTLGEDGVSKSGVTYVLKYIEDWDEVWPMPLGNQDARDTGDVVYFDLVYESGVPYLYLRDIPDSVDCLQIWWNKDETELSSDDDEADISKAYGDMPIIAGATYEVALKLDLHPLADIWKDRYFEEVGKLCQWQYDSQGSADFDYSEYA